MADRKVGLVMGVFDMYHVGHLNLLRRAKENCDYLRVGVMSDELTYSFKKKRPVIPLEERMKVLESVRYVDEVVAITDTPSRLEEYKKRPFDVFFSGDDYAGSEYWKWEKKELNRLGADIEFFSYTKSQSSTKIRKKLNEGKRKAAIFGYASLGRNWERAIRKNFSDEYEITCILDRKLAGKKAGDLVIHDSANAGELYRKGVFDLVKICVLDRNAASSIRESLKAEGIDELEIAPREYISLHDAGGKKLDGMPEGISVTEAQNLYAADLGLNRSPFLFDGGGRFIRDIFTEYQMNEYSLESYPFPFDEEDLEGAEKLTGNIALLSGIFSGNYWHFTYEVMSAVHLLEENGFDGRYIIKRTPFSERLMNLYGIEGKRIIYTDELAPVSLFERVTVVDFGEDAFENCAPVLADYAEKMAGRLEDGKKRPERIFVKRITNRKLGVSEEWLEKNGFASVVPEEHDVAEQIRFFMNADIVLSPHGANSAGGIYMKKGSAFIETFPDTYYNASNFPALRIRGIRYLPVVKSPVIIDGRNSGDRNVDYEIDEKLLDNAVEIAEITQKRGKE